MSPADLPGARFEVSRAAPDEWPAARAARLRALVAEPERFGVSSGSEETRTAGEWRQQLTGQSWFLARHRPDSAVAGLAVFYPDDLFPDGAPQLGSMWVDPAYRRRGVAGALAAAVEDAARRSGADSPRARQAPRPAANPRFVAYSAPITASNDKTERASTFSSRELGQARMSDSGGRSPSWLMMVSACR
jgi:GNAT superfamily N-acetyltransferase